MSQITSGAIMSNLTFYDRVRIEKYLNFQRLSLRDIARLIGRNVSVISREITRHKPQFSPYSAELAQRAAERKARNTNKKKLDKYPKLEKWVKAEIKLDHSPEQVAGRLKNYPPPELLNVPTSLLCMETIYQYIYQDAAEGGKLYTHLRRNKPKRQPRGQRKKRVVIPEKVSIEQREEVINNKERYGDFEIDMIVGKNGKGGISNNYERKMMLTKLHKLKSKKAEETTKAMKKTCEQFPPKFVKSATFDNGTENVEHTQIRDEYKIKTYFCDPYSPWQKGGVENSNGLVRQYIPKGTDMETVTPKRLYFIQERLNNRPRKGLGYLTPNEVLAEVIK